MNPLISNPQKVAARATDTNRIITISPEDALGQVVRAAHPTTFQPLASPCASLWKTKKFLLLAVDFLETHWHTLLVVRTSSAGQEAFAL